LPHTLVIRQINGSAPPRFEILRVRGADVKVAEAVEVPPPDTLAIEALPDGSFPRELWWYLEHFLDYPFSPDTERAERVLAALQAWGQKAFTSLFGSGRGRDYFHDATRDGAEQLHLQISSDDPAVLGWPWEALRDPDAGLVVLESLVERRLHNLRDPIPLPKELPKDRVNILLVTARPYAADVSYRSISRPLVELIAKHGLPAEVTILRPPTFARLRGHLRERPAYYHILHFDGHGGYGITAHSSGLASQGSLVFEKEDGSPDPVTAETLSQILREHRLPAVVLNACQSATIDDHAKDAFASVAAALVRAGVRSVVAMAYSLYVSGAQEFIPALYGRLFERGNLAEAARAGRQQMYARKGRVCARGLYDLHDWLVPVVYQQEPIDFAFAAIQPRERKDEPADPAMPHGFIGRDTAILTIERAMRRPPAGVLVHGLAGVGKTTLVRGLVAWLTQTSGLGAGHTWLTFNEIRSFEFVINAIGGQIFGSSFLAAPREEKLTALVRALREQTFVLVWDNFESVRGIAGTSVHPFLPAEDQAALRDLLVALRGGRTKVILTSRADETAWLGVEHCFPMPLAGLRGEELWEYCEAVLRDLGVAVRRDDPDLQRLLTSAGGHPLILRVLLKRVGAGWTAARAAETLRSNLSALSDIADDAERRLFAALRFAEDEIAEELRPLLVPLALHERFVQTDLLAIMTKQSGSGLTRTLVDRLVTTLAAAGLVRQAFGYVFELHPALTSFLRSCVPECSDPGSRDRWTTAFVEVMAEFANAATPLPFHEQRFFFHVHGENFRSALDAAERLAIVPAFPALLLSIASYAQHSRDLVTAERLYERLGSFFASRGESVNEANAYHQLGLVAQERRDLDVAERWYLKSLAIKEKQGDEHSTAITYHQLGRIAEERRDLNAAERLYARSLGIIKKVGHEHEAATTYHQLGVIAAERRDFDAAERWCLKSLTITEKQGDEHGSAITYHQLGMIAQERHDLDAAERWYLRSLAITGKQSNEHDAAVTCHQLGLIAEERRDFDAAERWYLNSLAIKEKQGDERGAAITYHQLGMIAQERRDFDAAERWHLKSLAITEKQGNEHDASAAYHQLGMIAQERSDLDAAERWYLRSLAIDEKQGNEHKAASTYAHLGVLAAMRARYVDAGRWMIRSTRSFLTTNDRHQAGRSTANFRLLLQRARRADQAPLRALWREAGLPEIPLDGTPP
jgi:tetratricopeptide (TPR) repeat protein